MLTNSNPLHKLIDDLIKNAIMMRSQSLGKCEDGADSARQKRNWAEASEGGYRPECVKTIIDSIHSLSIVWEARELFYSSWIFLYGLPSKGSWALSTPNGLLR
jgi:hypothetical protein